MLLHEENSVSKEVLKYENSKRELEEKILLKLDDKVTHDKEIKYLNRLLHEAKDSNVENELSLSRFENTYGKALLQLEKMNSEMENEKFDLDSNEQKNAEKQKEIDRLQAEIKNYEMLKKQKERKMTALNKKIEEVDIKPKRVINLESRNINRF